MQAGTRARGVGALGVTLNVAFVLGLPGATPSLECLLTFRTLDPSLASLLSWFFSRLTQYGQEEEKGEEEAGPFLVRPWPVVGHNTSPYPPWARTESLPCRAARDPMHVSWIRSVTRIRGCPAPSRILECRNCRRWIGPGVQGR